MQKEPLWERAAWVVIPLLLALLLGVGPRPLALETALHRVPLVLESGDEAALASSLVEIGVQQPWRDTLWERAGIAAVRAGQFEEALKSLENARRAGRLSAAGWEAVGQAYFALGQSTAAAQAWQQGLANAPSRAQAIRLHTQLLSLHLGLAVPGDLEAATGHLRSLADLEPGNPQHFYRLALLLAASEPQQAAGPLAQAAALDAQYEPAAVLLQGYLSIGQSSAVPGFVFQQSGRALGLLGEWRLAKHAFGQAVRLNPASAESWALLAEAFDQVGEDGAPALETALALDPESVQVNLLAGLHHKRRGAFEQSLAFLSAAAAVEPSNPTILAELASVAQLWGDAQAALAFYQRAAALTPDRPVFWLLLARFSIENNIQIEAVGLEAARAALALSSNSPDALDLIGYAYYQLGDYDQAGTYLTLALQAAPDFAPAHLHSGLLALELGDSAAARAALQNAAQLAPDTPTAEQALQILQQYLP